MRPNWTCTRLSSIFTDYSNNYECYQIEIRHLDDQEIEIELFANGRKDTAYDRTSDPVIDLCLILCKLDSNNKLRCIAYKHKIEQFGDWISITAKLNEGKYLVLATSIKSILIMDSEDNVNPFKYNVNFHSANQLDIKRALHAPDIVADFFNSAALFSKSASLKVIENIRFTDMYSRSFHGLLVENLSSFNCVRIKIDTKKNLNTIKTLKQNVSYHHLCPRQKQWLSFSVPADLRQDYKYEYEKAYSILLKENDSKCSNGNSNEIYFKSLKGIYAKKISFE